MKKTLLSSLIILLLIALTLTTSNVQAAGWFYGTAVSPNGSFGNTSGASWANINNGIGAPDGSYSSCYVDNQYDYCELYIDVGARPATQFTVKYGVQIGGCFGNCSILSFGTLIDVYNVNRGAWERVYQDNKRTSGYWTATLPLLHPGETYSLVHVDQRGPGIGSSVWTGTYYVDGGGLLDETYNPPTPTPTAIPLTVGFTSDTYSHDESGAAVVNVQLSQSSSSAVQVFYSTAGDTALAGLDYSDVSGSLYFNPGETEKSFAVPIFNDPDKEGDESVHLLLSSPVGAVLATSHSLLTISDNDSDGAFSAQISKPQTGAANLAYRFLRGDFSIAIDGMAASSNLAVTESAAPQEAQSIPPNFQAAGLYFDVALTDSSGLDAGFDQATICFPYLDEQWQSLEILETQLRLLHFEGDAWVDITAFQDVDENQLCGATSSFSPFAIVGSDGSQIGIGDTADGQIVLTAGTLSAVPSPIDFGQITLNGLPQSVVGAADPWTVLDARGSGDGWSLAVSASDFIRQGDPQGLEKTIPVEGFELSLPAENTQVVDGNTVPSSLVESFSPLSGIPLTIARALVDEGMGTFSIQPLFRLTVPPSTFQGYFISQVVATVISGPGL